MQLSYSFWWNFSDVFITATKAHDKFVSKQHDLATPKYIAFTASKVIRYKVVMQIQTCLCSMSNNYKLYDSFLAFEVRCCLLRIPAYMVSS